MAKKSIAELLTGHISEIHVPRHHGSAAISSLSCNAASRLVLALLLATVSSAVGCGKTNAAPAIPVSEVEVATIVQKDVPIFSEWIATLDGYVNAQIQPQVTGYIIRQTYKEGSFVRKGQILFQIDPRPFQAVLDQANAQLAQARAQLAKTAMDVDRDTPVAKAHAIAQSQLVFRVLFPNQVIRADELARAMWMLCCDKHRSAKAWSPRTEISEPWPSHELS